VPPTAPLICDGASMKTGCHICLGCMHINLYSRRVATQPPSPNLVWLAVVKCTGLKCPRLRSLLAGVDTHCWALDLEIIDL
jgi:hypothetical protein